VIVFWFRFLYVLNSNTSLSMYLLYNSRIHVITLYSGHECVYYALMLRCWHLVWILVRTDHPCLVWDVTHTPSSASPVSNSTPVPRSSLTPMPRSSTMLAPCYYPTTPRSSYTAALSGPRSSVAGSTPPRPLPNAAVRQTLSLSLSLSLDDYV
jgi:hypothetical protein